MPHGLGAPGLARLAPPYHDTDFVAKLSDVSPGGRSTLIQSGYLRAPHRRLDPLPHEARAGRGDRAPPLRRRGPPLPSAPGEARTYKVEIWPTAKRFDAGHGLRIALYSADTANHVTRLMPARNTVHAGSYLLLSLARRGRG